MKAKLQYLKLVLMLLPMGLAGTFFTSCDDDEKTKTVPIVTTAAVTEVTTTSAKGGGTITSNGNSTVTASGLVYSSVVAQPTVADDKTLVTATDGTFTSVMESLISGTTYHVRAYATNDIGTSYGEVIDFTTSNAAPIAINVSIAGNVEVNKELTATYSYTDAELDVEAGTTFQWYVANDGTGTGEIAITGATEQTYTIQDAQQDKYIRVGVTPKAGTGNIMGNEAKSVFVGAVGEATTVTFIYNGQEVTYGIITSTTTGKKWLDRNLGASDVPTAYNDYANYGDLFQWGRFADGHQLIVRNGPNDTDMSGVNGTTSTVDPFQHSSTDNPGHSLFITIANDVSPHDWRVPQNDNLWQGVNGTNNPCPLGWRIATTAEWAAENLGTIADGYTKLKLTLTGARNITDGAIIVPTGGRYWASTVEGASAIRTAISETGSTQVAVSRAFGYACRCIKE